METREQFLSRNIRERNEAIGNGGSVENIERWNREIKSFEEELARLQQEAQELPPEEEVIIEQTLEKVNGVPLELLTKSEDAAFLIRFEVGLIQEAREKANKGIIEDLRKRLTIANDSTEALMQDYNTLNTQFVDLSEQHAALTDDYNDLKTRYDERESKFNQIELERDKALQSRDNMSFEYEQMKVEVNKTRQVVELTEAERTAKAEAAMQRFLDGRIKVYNMRDEDEVDKTWRNANIAETGEEIRYRLNYEKGGYVDIGLEAALAMQAMNAELNAPEVDEEPIFPETASGESTSNLDATEDQGEQREALEVEPETFEERTERRLNAIEHRLNKNEPEFIHDIAS